MREQPMGEGDGFIQCAVTRHQEDGGQRADADRVAEETPVALVFNGISHAVMMATPCDLEALAVGFALTEGIVARRGEIFDVEAEFFASGAEVRLEIAQPAFLGLKERRRSLEGRSGCGVCGIESLALLDLAPTPIAAARRIIARADIIARAARELPEHQRLMRATGGVHAAAWCGPDGAVLRAFEDVGRHNAMDKLIGHLALQGAALDEGFVFMSSRASYELARKAARMGIPLLATISAPTSLAVDIARQAGMSLASFCRKNGFVEYTAG
ncbi:formate dehydrogenase accessory sulfurtransferase FdhD [Chromobacterium subtsugae]|uniref:Sulfur carrier protein FdhD n=1 Tax=Chromobacterium subtsugae TaxID=251747 RepID=A0ABS7FB02_9NEIS|nr:MULTISPECIES: formate dehydrogenase accessory sulfurtransferase FdhD [Chromobacterium]KUM05586.1 formate dehydrogenase family accessory protein FdhD [Chromobacterium subtsugae]KZE85675.1 formate dehydrogenase accessory protein FdhD [Chromobacterium sp. F49]MBW7566144.1 formate dehydrogenase accessory sulfurtransferase FdhD [Chromobacterium subtsugae]MBW8287265.1 formate dehydrogenase accessory sulfurtransferase FdhD [Chromobacterium subtsugae]WSE90543.1 formate dehydrogenase accessory sulfu